MEKSAATESLDNIKPSAKSKRPRRRMSAAEKRLTSLSLGFGFTGWLMLGIALSSYQRLATEIESTLPYDHSFLISLLLHSSLPLLAATGFMVGWIIAHFAERAAQRGRARAYLGLIILWALLGILPLGFSTFAIWFMDTDFLSDGLSLWADLVMSGGVLRMSAFHKFYTSWKEMKIIEQ